MNNMLDVAMYIIAQNPAISNNPHAQEWLEIIRTGDEKRGEEVANNLLSNLGLTKQQGLEAARRFFGF